MLPEDERAALVQSTLDAAEVAIAALERDLRESRAEAVRYRDALTRFVDDFQKAQDASSDGWRVHVVSLVAAEIEAIKALRDVVPSTQPEADK